MLGPTTRPVEKRGSSTVNVSASRMTASATSRRVTSQPASAGAHDTGSRSRSRARTGCGSSSSSASVTAAPSGKSAALVETRDLLVAELELGRRDVLLEVLDRARPRDRQHHRAAGQQPRERDLARRRAVGLGDLGDRAAGLGELARGPREPGDEADALLLAVLE